MTATIDKTERWYTEQSRSRSGEQFYWGTAKQAEMWEENYAREGRSCVALDETPFEINGCESGIYLHEDGTIRDEDGEAVSWPENVIDFGDAIRIASETLED